MKRERLVKNANGDFVWMPIEKKVVNHDERKIYSTLYSQPEVSVAAGCNSTQVNEFNEMYKQRGIVGAYHRPDGACVFESNAARNAVLRARGLYDRDASYGQFAGNEKED